MRYTSDDYIKAVSHQSHEPNIEVTQQRVLYVVDDDQDDRTYGCRSLSHSERIKEIRPMRNAGDLFKCLEDKGLYDSMAYADENTPVILLDLHMPSMNGIDALACIRNHPITSDFPVILLTTDVSGNRIEEAHKLQASGFLEKPFNLDKFHDVLDHIDAGRSAMQFGE